MTAALRLIKPNLRLGFVREGLSGAAGTLHVPSILVCVFVCVCQCRPRLGGDLSDSESAHICADVSPSSSAAGMHFSR